MKTTNFEISKKLKEIGLEANANYSFIKRSNQDAFLRNIKELSDIEIMNESGDFIKSYDLETLIDALPNGILFNRLEAWEEEGCISLADRAGRLLIKLFENGIINFKK